MLSQTGVYAVRAMGYIASKSKEDDKPILSRTIAADMQIPANFLSKIMHRLVQAGLIQSVRGRNGGFVLAKPASTIRVRDVIDLFMQLDNSGHCLIGITTCDGSCGLHHRWSNIVEQFELMINETAIDKIL